VEFYSEEALIIKDIIRLVPYKLKFKLRVSGCFPSYDCMIDKITGNSLSIRGVERRKHRQAVGKLVILNFAMKVIFYRNYKKKDTFLIRKESKNDKCSS
jgi:hypothetical protein